MQFAHKNDYLIANLFDGGHQANASLKFNNIGFAGTRKDNTLSIRIIFLCLFDENMVFHNEYRREAFENLAQGQSTNRKNVKEENLFKTKKLKVKDFNQTRITGELNVDKATICRYFKEIENEVVD